MINAKVLYQQGVAAIRERKDFDAARDLLTRSLKLEPNNVAAWVVLAHITADSEQKRRYLGRALKLDPTHARARKMLGELPHAGLPPTHLQQMERYMMQGRTLQERGDEMGAVEQWNAALKIQPDNEDALKAAIKILMKLDYPGDAQTLVMRAIDAGTRNPAIYLTAIDFARLNNDAEQYDVLRQRLVRLPDVDEATIMRVVDSYMDAGRRSDAEKLLKIAIKRRPDNQSLLLSMGDLQTQLGFDSEAVVYYHQAAAIDRGTLAGREADEKLLSHAPVLTDKERGSLLLAWREALGVAVLYLLLAWQDAGLNLGNMMPENWLGVALGLIGGYVLVTATSSPQQMPLARVFGTTPTPSNAGTLVRMEGGTLQEVTALPIIPMMVRYVLGTLGILMLAAGFYLIFGTALELLLNPVDPNVREIFEGF